MIIDVLCLILYLYRKVSWLKRASNGLLVSKLHPVAGQVFGGILLFKGKGLNMFINKSSKFILNWLIKLVPVLRVKRLKLRCKLYLMCVILCCLWNVIVMFLIYVSYLLLNLVYVKHNSSLHILILKSWCLSFRYSSVKALHVYTVTIWTFLWNQKQCKFIHFVCIFCFPCTFFLWPFSL